MKSAILVVSFGTTHLDTLAKTIQAVEEDIRAAFPDMRVYRAFTSKIVRSRLKSKYDMTVDSVEEALERMKGDGVERVLVQPTLLIPGEEYDRLRGKVLLHAGPMTITMGRPVLWDDRDCGRMIRILEQTYPVDGDTVLLAMGHGTEHESNCLYVRLAEKIEKESRSLALCTVEGKPDFEETIGRLKKQEKRKVHLAPLLLVAGDHAKNDMAGEEPDSLRGLLEQAGFAVSWTLRGLGEIPAVRELYVNCVREAMESP